MNYIHIKLIQSPVVFSSVIENKSSFNQESACYYFSWYFEIVMAVTFMDG